MLLNLAPLLLTFPPPNIYNECVCCLTENRSSYFDSGEPKYTKDSPGGANLKDFLFAYCERVLHDARMENKPISEDVKKFMTAKDTSKPK